MDNPMKKHRDEELYSALWTDASAVEELNQAVVARIHAGEKASASALEGFIGEIWKRLRLLAPVPALAPVLASVFVLAFSQTAYAAVRFLTASEAAGELSCAELANAFASEDALVIGETRESRGFDITLLGITYGSVLQEYLEGDMTVAPDRIYAVVALSKTDGTPLPALTRETQEEIPDLFMTFLAKGISPDDNPLNQTRGGPDCTGMESITRLFPLREQQSMGKTDFIWR